MKQKPFLFGPYLRNFGRYKIDIFALPYFRIIIDLASFGSCASYFMNTLLFYMKYIFFMKYEENI